MDSPRKTMARIMEPGPVGRSILGVGDSHRRPIDVFLRLLGFVYFIAFASLAVQVRGLIGQTGIMPAGTYLAHLTELLGSSRAFLNAPSLFWLSHEDVFLAGACWLGAGFSLLIVAGFAQGPLLFLNWALYLSLVSVGQVFLRYQWDVLLLESGFLAIWLAPWRPWTSPRSSPEPSLLLVWLVRWLTFRLMLSSGWVKIRSDEVWRNLSALDFHPWTQPLPTWTAWWLSQAPEFILKAGVAATLIVELGIPWLIFFGRPGRKIACLALAAFQILLMLTGNFGFFNLLALALCIPLWSRPAGTIATPATPPVLPSGENPGPAIASGDLSPEVSRWIVLRRYSAILVAWLIIILSLGSLARTEQSDLILPYPVDAVERHLAPFHIVNRYGLFADMTEERPELVLEVSSDGTVWEPLRFRWKPGRPDRRPRFTLFHMPRLDWQMWFEGLNYLAQTGYYDARRIPSADRIYYANRWFYSFAQSCLKGPNAATGLLEDFPADSPPRFIRAVAFRYRFSTPPERRETGHWWTRRPMGTYLPALSAGIPQSE